MGNCAWGLACAVSLGTRKSLPLLISWIVYCPISLLAGVPRSPRIRFVGADAHSKLFRSAQDKTGVFAYLMKLLGRADAPLQQQVVRECRYALSRNTWLQSTQNQAGIQNPKTRPEPTSLPHPIRGAY